MVYKWNVAGAFLDHIKDEQFDRVASGHYARIRKIYNCDTGAEERTELLLCPDEVFLSYSVPSARALESLNTCNTRCENLYTFSSFLGGIALIVLLLVRLMSYICDVRTGERPDLFSITFDAGTAVTSDLSSWWLYQG